jgi:hypothetical protein
VWLQCPARPGRTRRCTGPPGKFYSVAFWLLSSVVATPAASELDRSAADAEGAVDQLTPAARAQLRFFLRFRDRPLTVWGQFAANRGKYLFLLAFTCTGVALLYIAGGPTAAAFIVVASATAVVRDIGLFRRAALGWPVTRSVIDWPRVERLLAADGTPSAEPDAAADPAS